MAQTYSKTIELTDTTDGHKIDYSSFGLADQKSFFYFRIESVSTGTLSIKFGSSDDYIDISSYPVIFSDGIRFKEIYVKPSETLNINLIVFLV